MITHYMVMKRCSFKDTLTLEPNSVLGLTANLIWGDDEPKWFAPIFETKAAAEEWADNGRFQILEIQTADEETSE